LKKTERWTATRMALSLLSLAPLAACSKGAGTGAEVETVQSGVIPAGDTLSPANLQLSTLTNSCGANQAQDFFKIVNSGTTPVTLSDITVKLWVDDTSGQTLAPHISTGGCLTNASGTCVHQVAGATAKAQPFTPACGPDATHQANWEVTISNTDSTALGPNVSWTNLQAALNLANFSNFTPGTGHWYSPCLPGSAYVSDNHFAVYVKGNLVLSSTSGITAPTCRSPHGGQQLTGYVLPQTTAAPRVGPAPATLPIMLAIGLPVSDPVALQTQVQQVSDPSSPSYRQYLTPDQFTATFSPTAADYLTLSNWATSNGLTVGTYPNRLLLDVSGTVAQIERALFVNLELRSRPDGTSFYVADREPSLNLSIPLQRISGLDNFALAVPRAGIGTGPGGFHASADFRGAYASCTTLRGEGQAVGLFELDGYLPSDITTYECFTGLATCDPTNTTILAGTVPALQNVLVDGSSGGVGSGQSEVTVDIEAVVAMAPGLSKVSVFEAPNDGNIAHSNHILNKMAADTSIKQFSCSWGIYTDANTQTILRALARQGQSFFLAGGDTGSFSWNVDPSEINVLLLQNSSAAYDQGLRSVDDLDAITVVGGTALDVAGSPPAYLAETTWNVTGEGASSGGVERFVPVPLYQAGFAAAVGAAGSRVVPDVSMPATGILSVINAKGGGASGSSFAAPLMAGFVALANQQSAAKGIGPAGFINTFLYDIGAAGSAIYNGSFNDINDGSTSAGNCPSGRNINSCPGGKWTASATGAFSAVAGYDLATGLGSPKCHLLDELATSIISLPPTPDAGAPGTGGSGGGTGGSGGGTDGGVIGDGPLPPPSLVVVATEGGQGVEFCMQGSGFTPGHLVQFQYLNLPGLNPGQTSSQSPEIVDSTSSFSNFDPTFGGGAASQQGFIQNCSASDLTRSMTIQVFQVDDPTRMALTSISNSWICGKMPTQNEFNETPLPFPPQFGEQGCPLPPD
jgi:hypothetical protein